MLNIKQLVKGRIEEAKKYFKENKEFKKKIHSKIKVARREAFEKQIELEAKKSGRELAKRHFAPKPPITTGMFNIVGQPPSKQKKGKQKPQRQFDPFRDLIQ